MVALNVQCSMFNGESPLQLPAWWDSSNVKRERAVGDGYGIEGMGWISCTFSRHAKAETSFALVIWLNENVPIEEFSLA